jgi:hypothetical protein
MQKKMVDSALPWRRMCRKRFCGHDFGRKRVAGLSRVRFRRIMDEVDSCIQNVGGRNPFNS